jgi:hypothetical protein
LIVNAGIILRLATEPHTDYVRETLTIASTMNIRFKDRSPQQEFWYHPN